jgi:ParB family chromosome partitioning protein
MREFRQLETDAVHESTNNPRRAFPEASLEELAASVRRYGVLQPILVRPNGNGFVLIARRASAARREARWMSDDSCARSRAR